MLVFEKAFWIFPFVFIKISNLCYLLLDQRRKSLVNRRHFLSNVFGSVFRIDNIFLAFQKTRKSSFFILKFLFLVV